MTHSFNKKTVKRILGDIPYTAEAYWLLRQRGRPLNRGFNLNRTQAHLSEWLEQAAMARRSAPPGKRVLIFTTLRYWIEHGVLLGLSMAGLGHTVTLAYLPYANWRKPLNRFDQRRQDLYTRSVLDQTAPVMKSISFYAQVTLPTARSKSTSIKSLYNLPEELVEAVKSVSLRDVQYTLQEENVDLDSDLYRLRLRRNSQAAKTALDWIESCGLDRPEVILIPNGSILEMGAVYNVARYLEIPVVTYEFGEQRDRIWLAKDTEVMLQETDQLWEAYQEQPLSGEEWEKVRALFAARQGANLWENFSRRWQGQPSQGGAQVRQALGLDERPIILLAANVIGDSLTLGRQVFSSSMSDWLERSIRYFLEREEYQLVVRIHPGEQFTKGPSVANLVHSVQAVLPPHVHVVDASDPTNTYDIVEIADLGLVYTTTTGMEMAMNGVPVVVAGRTHYRSKGFTLDPDSWEEYFNTLERVLGDPQAYQLDQRRVERAWTYAFRFFFNYPLPFPWHLIQFWESLPAHPLEQVLSLEGQAEYGEAFRALAGGTRRWRI